MATYSTSIKASYFDPRTDIKNRISEFRLDKDSAYMPNLRLSNVGTTTAGAHTVPYLVGHLGVIRHIRLMDGNVELSSTRHANRWLSFVNQNSDNQSNICVSGVLSKHSVGYLLQDNGLYVDNPGFYDKKAEATDDGINSAYLQLNKVFPILEGISYLDTANTFKNLKVVIEYEDDKRMTNRSDAAVPVSLTPLLIADQITDPSLVSKLQADLKSIVWDEIEHDQFTVPNKLAEGAALADTGSVEQVHAAVINGFDNKYVSRFLIMKAWNDKADSVSSAVQLGYGNYASLSQYKEKVQVRFNGANMFAGNGLDRTSDKAMMLAQAWGPVNILPFSNQQSAGLSNMDEDMVNQAGVPASYDQAGAVQKEPSPRVGQSEYIGFQVEDRVRQLNFTYSRSNVKDNSEHPQNNSAIDLHIFGECRKTLTIGANGYNVSYA